MTKEQYYEACEMMGNEPIEEEIPVELEDLPTDVQIALQIYGMLPDEWDTMVGRYAGKKMQNIKDIFDICEVEKADRRMLLTILLIIDNLRMQDINSKRT